MDKDLIIREIFVRNGVQIGADDALMQLDTLLELHRAADRDRASREARDATVQLSRALDRFVRDRFTRWLAVLLLAALGIYVLGILTGITADHNLWPQLSPSGPCVPKDGGEWCWVPTRSK